MSNQFDFLKEKIKDFPTQSGVYLMKSSSDKIIYVGKAKNIRSRVKSYFLDSRDHSAKTRALVHNIHEIEYLLTKTEVEAFLLEASLIKKHRPKYNIRLKDDKTYPYIQLTWQDDFPRLYLSRKVKRDGSLYFGPYTSGGAVFGTIRFLNRLFKIRDCTDHMFKTRTRPCMTHQIGRCTAPCVNLISKEDYRSDVEGAKDFLKGRSKKLIKDLEKKMKQAADEEKFEVAAKMRDSMFAIKNIIEKQTVINELSEKDQDVVSYYGDERGVLVETLHVRSGRVIGHRPHFLPNINPLSPDEDPREWLASFLNQYYEDNFIPDEVLLGTDLGGDIHKLLQDVLKERSDQVVAVRFATDNKGQALVEMATQNAKAHFDKYVSKDEEKKKGLDEIQAKLHLPNRPTRIECFDISHFQGSETVASQVVFEDGVPSRDHYRRYKIRTVSGIDDFASMYEVLKRRFAHEEYEEPQLIVVDGGKGQLSMAVKILEEIGKTHIPVVGLAKARTLSDFKSDEVQSTEERFFLPNRSNPVVFKTNSEAYQILTGLRDEAHRFAITYHRKLREQNSLESELDYVVGLGEKRKKILLQKFQTIDEIRQAEVDEIAALRSFNRVLAERILLQLNEAESGSDEDKSEDLLKS
ncbi:excinuclease ABC subunit UvrC [Pseudobdellovibrio exovorus]|uniref:UvrABC system protein C n=1 Tax=Pseudobdellovibrio exovorus JSS TaxID=1184267 RepID=M4V7Q7_9BACT|nr:excinuclease ABC subunit UvrC [Pseudobdellovibrio exovorus]AGH95253.1 excinuclease ABC subunit C [Pseudobdellovibrio exovorus JSS]